MQVGKSQQKVKVIIFFSLSELRDALPGTKSQRVDARDSVSSSTKWALDY